MHAVKRMAARSRHNSTTVSEDNDALVQRTKTRLRERFETLAGSDHLFSSLFSLRELLGVGSFGMVMRAEAVVDITVERLVQVQDAKCKAGGVIEQQLMRRRGLKRQPDSVILRQGQSVAVKFEYNIDQQRRKFQLVKEHDLLVEMFNFYGAQLEGFPEPYLFGYLGSSTFVEDAGCGSQVFAALSSSVFHCYHFMVMEMLGDNLRARFDREKRFRLSPT